MPGSILERNKVFFYDMGKFVLSHIIKRSAGCALRRTMKLSYATAAGARMCEAHSLFYGELENLSLKGEKR